MNQINLNYKFPEWVKWLGWVLFITMLIFLKSCEGKNTQTIEVVVPEKKGEFKPQKTNHTALTVVDTFYLKGKTIIKENPINKILIAENEQLQKDFFEADSINKFLMFSFDFNLI